MPRSIELKAYLAPGFLIAVVAFVSLQLQSMRADISAMSERLVRVEVEVEKIGPLSVKVDSLSTDVATLTVKVDNIDKRLTGVESRLTGVEGRLTGVEGRLTGVEGRLTGVEGRLTGVEGRLTGVEGRLTGVEGRLTIIEEREAHRELLQELHRQLEIRFDESDEGVAYGGPGLAVDRLLLRAKPAVDEAFADILASPRSESPMLLTQDISNDLWERRMQFLERSGPSLP